MARTHRRIYRRNARPNENEIPTVRIVRRRNPLGSPLTAGEASALQSILAKHGYSSNPRRRKHKRKGHRKVRVSRHSRKARAFKVPKGKRVGSHFKRHGRWFRVAKIKVRRGRRKVTKRVVRKSTFRAAMRAGK